MLNLAQMVNPYAFFPKNSMLDSLDSDTRERWMHSGSSSRTKLRQHYSAGMEAGVSTLVLCTHDYLPQLFPGNYVLYAERDEEAYINLQEAHLELINSLYSWSRARNPKVRLEFIPPWYSNDKHLPLPGLQVGTRHFELPCRHLKYLPLGILTRP